MVIDNSERKTSFSRHVERICDVCGKHEIAILRIVLDGRLKRKSNVDCCKKCSYKFRNVPQGKMSESPSWNGGRYLNENGYYRVYVGNLRYAYEHKVVMEKLVGRPLSIHEKVHHIDGNKTNNDPNNLYLFPSKREHYHCHHSLELSCLSLLGKEIWFDAQIQSYVVSPRQQKTWAVDLSDLFAYKTFQETRWPGGSAYAAFTRKQIAKELGHNHLHSVIAERLIGRKLLLGEVVHHIDGNGLNNDPTNLAIMNKKTHKECHDSLGIIGLNLFKCGKILFKDGKYEIAYS